MASILRHYRRVTAAGESWVAVGPLVAANRALVVSKITVTYDVSSGTAAFFLAATAAQTTPQQNDLLAVRVPIGVGEVYTETGIILLAGEGLAVNALGTAAVVVNFFGEEVDN